MKLERRTLMDFSKVDSQRRLEELNHKQFQRFDARQRTEGFVPFALVDLSAKEPFSQDVADERNRRHNVKDSGYYLTTTFNLDALFSFGKYLVGKGNLELTYARVHPNMTPEHPLTQEDDYVIPLQGRGDYFMLRKNRPTLDFATEDALLREQGLAPILVYDPIEYLNLITGVAVNPTKRRLYEDVLILFREQERREIKIENFTFGDYDRGVSEIKLIYVDADKAKKLKYELNDLAVPIEHNESGNRAWFSLRNNKE